MYNIKGAWVQCAVRIFGGHLTGPFFIESLSGKDCFIFFLRQGKLEEPSQRFVT